LVAAGPEFIAADCNHGFFPIAVPDRSLDHQLKWTHALQQKRPLDPELYVSGDRQLLIRLDSNVNVGEVPRKSSTEVGDAFPLIGEVQLHLYLLPPSDQSIDVAHSFTSGNKRTLTHRRGERLHRNHLR
jgi:hypothetical protein